LQVWAYTGNKELRCDDICLDVARSGGPVNMVKCHGMKGNQVWEYDKNVSEIALIGYGIHLFVKVPRPGDSEGTFESTCHLLLPV